MSKSLACFICLLFLNSYFCISMHPSVIGTRSFMNYYLYSLSFTLKILSKWTFLYFGSKIVHTLTSNSGADGLITFIIMLQMPHLSYSILIFIIYKNLLCQMLKCFNWPKKYIFKNIKLSAQVKLYVMSGCKFWNGYNMHQHHTQNYCVSLTNSLNMFFREKSSIKKLIVHECSPV